MQECYYLKTMDNNFVHHEFFSFNYLKNLIIYVVKYNFILSPQENPRYYPEKYLFVEYAHVDIYLRESKNREQSPVRKLLLYALDECKLKVYGS